MPTDRYIPMFGTPITPWSRTFAYVPRWTPDAGWVWLRPVWKRKCAVKFCLGGSSVAFWWQYRRFYDAT